MTQRKYPLAQVVEIKKRRVEQQEEVVRQKKETLEQENRKLIERKKERQKVKDHYDEKLKQLRAELDGETTTDKIKMMKNYLKEVQERLKVEDKKVKEQEDQVKLAEKEVELAIEELRRKRIDVDKLHTHKKDWEVEVRKEEEIINAREEDEMGTIIFSKHTREKM